MLVGGIICVMSQQRIHTLDSNIYLSSNHVDPSNISTVQGSSTPLVSHGILVWFPTPKCSPCSGLKGKIIKHMIFAHDNTPRHDGYDIPLQFFMMMILMKNCILLWGLHNHVGDMVNVENRLKIKENSSRDAIRQESCDGGYTQNTCTKAIFVEQYPLIHHKKSPFHCFSPKEAGW